VLDLDRYSSVVQAYEEAVAAGTDLVVGPLSKQGVSALGGLSNRPVPVLALNQVNEMLPAGNTALVQLALAPEDEAGQIAQIAFGQGARRALVIRPAGSWGAKMEQALLKRWTALGGELAAVASYSGQEDYSSSMAAGLHLPQSEQRAREVRSMLATNIEFTPRRRQDLDVIFLLARNGSEARSLKPLLAYHYAGELPVYATSSIYRGIPDTRDKDLNGVRLVDIPWLLGGNPPLHAAFAAAGTGSDNYTRLNALGADAYLLQSRFNQLQGGPDVQIRGNTGLLSLDSQLRIQRELQAAAFGGGVLTPN
jgi:outer membrane PBP1 activator LpoA protein